MASFTGVREASASIKHSLISGTLKREPEATTTLDKVQLGYAAGIIDGEGTISLVKSACKTCKSEFRYRITLTMSNTSLKLVKRFQSWFGGAFYIIPKREQDRQQQYKWQLNAIFEQIAFLKLIKPYLFVKQKQAELALEFLNNSGYYNQHTMTDTEQAHRRGLYQHMYWLNHRGAEPQRLSGDGEDSSVFASDSPIYEEE